MSKGEKIPHVVVAVAREDARFKAVELHRHDRQVEILWTRSLPADGQTWSGFAGECGLAPDGTSHDSKMARKHAPAVIGLDLTSVAFYRVTAPAVDEHEMAAIVRMQAESLLPLPPDQIEVAWRANHSTNGNADVTIAAARKEYLYKFAENVRDLRPRNIFLSCEGTAKAWQSLFSAHERLGEAGAAPRVRPGTLEPHAVLVSLGAENTQVCLVQDGLVTRAAVLDLGGANLLGTGGEEPAGPSAETLERFAHDLRAILSSFGWNEASPWPLFVLSDGSPAHQHVVESLNASGLPATASVPSLRGLKTPAGFEAKDVYEYRTLLGLALIALEKPALALNLFGRVLEEQEQQKAASAWRSVALAGAAAVLMLIVLFATVYLTDVSSARRWDALVQRPAFQAAVQQQALLKTVARHRPDLLELLTAISTGENDGVVLDSLHFKKGQTVSLAGQAGNMEQMWKYQTNLRAQKSIKDAEIQNAAPDTKTKKIKFTITLHYKEFTKKDAAL